MVTYSFGDLAMTYESKPAISSLTIRALIVGIIALLGIFGTKVVVEDDQINKVVEGIGALIIIATSLIGIYGRYRASEPLEGVLKKPDDEGGGPPNNHLLMVLFLMFALFTLPGCAYSRTEHQVWRDGFYNGTKTARNEHLSWSKAIAGEPGYNLPNIQNLPQADRDLWLKTRLRNFDEAEKTYREDQSADEPLLFK